MAGFLVRRLLMTTVQPMFKDFSQCFCSTSCFIRTSFLLPTTKFNLSCQRFCPQLTQEADASMCSVAENGSAPASQKPTYSAGETNATEILNNLTLEEAKRLKVLRLEYDVFNSSGVRVPEEINDEEWLYLLQKCPSISSRKKRYMYLFKTEKSQLNEKAKARARLQQQEEKRAKMTESKEEGDFDFKNTFLLYVQENTMNRLYRNNLAYAMLNGPHIVFDFSFEESMTDQELINLFKQMQLCHGVNKVVREPFHFHFCNVAPESQVAYRLNRAISNLDEIPITVTNQHYLDCYPKDRLVYLSPNAPKVLEKFDFDDVYIVGGIVDRAEEEPLTFAKAKKEKIRMARFPLDEHVRWIQGSKSLTLDQTVKILLDLKQNNSNWKDALIKNLPKRKYVRG